MTKSLAEIAAITKMVDAGEFGLTFERLRRINSARSLVWMRGKPWSLADWMVALVGEVGEGANLLKKISRIDLGLVGSLKVEDTDREALAAEFRLELADMLMYLDLLAEAAGVNLEEVVIEKFNKKSEQLGFEERL